MFVIDAEIKGRREVATSSAIQVRTIDEWTELVPLSPSGKGSG